MKILKTALVAAITSLMATGSVLAATDLKINTWDGYITPELSDKFTALMKEKHGIDVAVKIHNVASQDEARPALLSGKADIVTSPQNIPKDGRHRLIKDRLLLEIDPAKIENFAKIMPALQKPDYMVKKGKLYGIPLIRGPFAIMYNTSLMDKPDSWNVLWDPKYKGKISIPGDVYDALIYSVALSEGVSREDIFDISKIDTPKIRAKLKTLAENADNYWSGVATAGDAMGLAMAPSWGFAVPELRNRGENWKMAYVKEGVTGYVDNLFVGGHVAEDPEKLTAAYEWLNFSLSDEYQTHIVRYLAATPVTTSVKDVLTPEEISDLYLDDPDHFKKNIILWQPVNKRVSDGMKAMWRSASASVVEKKLAAAEVRRNAMK